MFAARLGKRTTFIAQDTLRGKINPGGSGRAGQFGGRPGSHGAGCGAAMPASMSVMPGMPMRVVVGVRVTEKP
jgi:hypothetical protein